MNLLRRPWQLSPDTVESASFGPDDCHMGISDKGQGGRASYSTLLSQSNRELRLFPYPKKGHAELPFRIAGLPARPKIGLEPKTPEEQLAVEASARMHRVLARIEELEAALDDPENLWQRLADAWTRAEDDTDPRMAEIVRQSKLVKPHLVDLEKRIRQVLRRTREQTPLDRVQEMDRASMLWMVRQPGTTVAERAGSDQRILAIARHENFDTLENRVFHAYLNLASHFARQWLREHKRAENSLRYRNVESYRRLCRRQARTLSDLGVGVAEPGVVSNYVLMEDRAYRAVNDAWERLLRQDKAEDELWAWQAESWTDFCILAVSLALYQLDESDLVAQSPLVWLEEAVQGRRFLHDRPLAVYWLKESNLIVELQARPKDVTTVQFASNAHVWLKVTDLESFGTTRRIPIWTPHSFNRMTPVVEARSAAQTLELLRRQSKDAVMREGVILMQGHGKFESQTANQGSVRLQAIAFDAVGETLGDGKKKLTQFIKSCFRGEKQ